MNTTKRVIELIRVSTKAQAGDDRASIPAQKTICKRIAADNKLQIDWTIQMEDVSGAAVMYSPEMHRMIDLINSDQVHGIVTREWSRLMRPENYGDYALLQLLVEHKIIVYLPDGPTDLSTSSGAFMGQIQLAVAGLERRQIRDRMTAGREQMRREGRNCSSPDTWPCGVAWNAEQNRWTWTDDIEKVVRLFTLFTSGTTSFADLHRETGIPYYSIPVILKNTVYTGVRVFDTRRDGSHNGKVLDEFGHIRYTRKLKRAPEDVLRVRIFDKGAISDDTFVRAQQLLTMKRTMHQRGGRQREERFLYRGLLRCGRCSENLYTITANDKRSTGIVPMDYYVCRARRGVRAKHDVSNRGVGWTIPPNSCDAPGQRRERLEPAIDEIVSLKLTDERFLAALLKQQERASEKKDNRARIDRLERDLASVVERRERLADLYIDGKLSKEQHAQRLIKLEQEEQASRRALAELTREQLPAGVSVETLATLLEPFAAWSTLQHDEKRALVCAVMPAIKVSDYKVQGVWLAVAGEADPTQVAPRKAVTSQRGASSSLAAIPSVGHVNYESHRITAPNNHMPIYLPLQAA